MGFAKPQQLAKFEVAGFIYYGNIRELVFKIWDKLTLPLDSETQCFLFDVQTVVELRLQQIGDFFTKKKHILQWKILNFGGCKVGVENFCTKLPKGTPLRQIWSKKSFGACGSNVVLTLYGDEKKVWENRH